MKPFICAFLLCCGQFSLHAQAPATDEAKAGVQALMQRLFAQDTTEEDLQSLAKEANKIGVPRQQIIEAKLVWGLRHQSTPFLLKILPEVEILANSFDPASAAALPNVAAVKAFIAYIKALKAGEAQDAAGFKQNILEAIWLNPQQAQVFIQAIEKFHLEAKMAALVIDLKIPLTTSMGEATTLSDQLGSGKALLLDFWASWCGPCMALMPALKEKAKMLPSHGIVVAAMNKDDGSAEATAEATAERIRQEQNATLPWLVEPAERPYTKALEIATIPRMVLLSPEGKVLFNGHPEDPALWVALKKVDPTIEAPGH
ncbi:TlpA disulfide reductase family protein [Prosthecobacter sp.]|uniref:TlpA family protein disulfide reductase n=1 Tax=Prosthecobacter sp. TaxID=1965333 RepID=UPI002487F906|nr:TlpA disulfide reductase family protein [Prosthecobacter sp.]MDI1315274.1 TlpA disulfide reductase family protein [Prosthecobacter sp.]